MLGTVRKTASLSEFRILWKACFEVEGRQGVGCDPMVTDDVRLSRGRAGKASGQRQGNQD